MMNKYVIGRNKEDVQYVNKFVLGTSFVSSDIHYICQKILSIFNSEPNSVCVIADSVYIGDYEKYFNGSKFIDNIFEVPFECFNNDSLELNPNLIYTPMLTSGRIGSLQFNLVNYCNMSCNLCSHFCPLTKRKYKMTKLEFKKIALRVSDLVSHVDCVDLWGGEAFLNKDLPFIVRDARNIFVNSIIHIGTNGLLLPKMSSELANAIKDTNSTIVISKYPKTIDILDDIESIIDKYSFDVIYVDIDKFFKRTDLKGNNTDSYELCTSKNCHTIQSDYFSPCYFPLAVDILNDKFNTNFDSTNSVFDIFSDKLTLQEFSKIMKSEIDCCKYCGKIELHDWSICNRKTTQLSDWCHSVG